jgi:hypothetical protein
LFNIFQPLSLSRRVDLEHYCSSNKSWSIIIFTKYFIMVEISSNVNNKSIWELIKNYQFNHYENCCVSNIIFILTINYLFFLIINKDKDHLHLLSIITSGSSTAFIEFIIIMRNFLEPFELILVYHGYNNLTRQNRVSVK